MSTEATPEGFAIREARPGDSDTLCRIVLSVLEEFGLQADLAAARAEMAEAAARYPAAGGVLLVVTDPREAVVGCGGFYPAGEATAELRRMYLLPGARGLGLGRALLERLLLAARERKFRRVELETASVLKSAIALYGDYGFRPASRSRASCGCDQFFVLDLEAGEGARSAPP